MYRAILIVLAGCLPLLAVQPASAVMQMETLMFSGEIVGGENPGYVVNSTAVFEWDDACDGTTMSFCELTITLTAETTGSGAAPSQGEILSGLVFDVFGSADFRDGPPGNTPWGGTVIASALEGSGAATALMELGGLDVSGHWGLNPALSVPGRGSHLLSSVGDAFGGPDEGGGTLGSGQLFPGTVSMSIEDSPPNGSNFGIIDANSSSGGSGWPIGDLAYVQDNVVATLLYTDILTGIDLDETEPIYGTEGYPIPEPATAALVGLGMLGLAIMGRRQRRS